MKRVAAIAVIAALMLTMSVGTAFAGTCVGIACSSSPWKCADSAKVACPTGASDASLHSGCHHAPERDVKDAVGVQSALDHALPAGPVAAVDPAALLGAAARPSAPDARGAPHLTAVIRI